MGSFIMRKHSRRRWHRRALAPMLAALLVLNIAEDALSKPRSEPAASLKHHR